MIGHTQPVVAPEVDEETAQVQLLNQEMHIDELVSPETGESQDVDS
jgi:hypothetical protein